MSVKLTNEELDEIKDKQCRYCKYRQVLTGSNGSPFFILCSYILDTGKMRNCSVKECDKFEEGTPRRNRSIRY